MFNDDQEGKTHFADDDTLKYISRLEKKVKVYEDFTGNLEIRLIKLGSLGSVPHTMLEDFFRVLIDCIKHTQKEAEELS